MSEYINSFPGYEYVKLDDGKYHNMYRGTDLGFGGYVYAEPGIYFDVALLDVASLHPTSIVVMNKLGKYTKRYADLRAARVYIKHGEYEKAAELFDGKLKKYLGSKDEAEALSKALKLPLNAFYGISDASFPTRARDIKDKNNIIALRGALFMRTLQDEVVKRGFTVAHIKTDSIKIPNATPEIIQFVMDFGYKYGYTFEHEATYERMCLVNDAVYIAKYKGGKHDGEWTATGTQFAVPYVFKSLFSHEPVTFEDFCETKSVSKGSLYLDMNECLPDVTAQEKELDKARQKYKKGAISDISYEEIKARLEPKIEEGHSYQFVGRVGQFCPVKPGLGGGVLYRMQDGKYYAATGTTGYRWLESESIRHQENAEDMIDKSFYISLANDAIETISKYGDFNAFVSDDPLAQYMNIPEDSEEEVPFAG